MQRGLLFVSVVLFSLFGSARAVVPTADAGYVLTTQAGTTERAFDVKVTDGANFSGGFPSISSTYDSGNDFGFDAQGNAWSSIGLATEQVGLTEVQRVKFHLSASASYSGDPVTAGAGRATAEYSDSLTIT